MSPPDPHRGRGGAPRNPSSGTRPPRGPRTSKDSIKPPSSFLPDLRPVLSPHVLHPGPPRHDPTLRPLPPDMKTGLSHHPLSCVRVVPTTTPTVTTTTMTTTNPNPLTLPTLLGLTGVFSPSGLRGSSGALPPPHHPVPPPQGVRVSSREDSREVGEPDGPSGLGSWSVPHHPPHSPPLSPHLPHSFQVHRPYPPLTVALGGSCQRLTTHGSRGPPVPLSGGRALKPLPVAARRSHLRPPSS